MGGSDPHLALGACGAATEGGQEHEGIEAAGGHNLRRLGALRSRRAEPLPNVPLVADGTATRVNEVAAGLVCEIVRAARREEGLTEEPEEE